MRRLERARLADPYTPSLTLPEWERLQAFGLGTLAAVRQRLEERAMLAAYDGAPSALSEFTTERLPVPAVREPVPNRNHEQSQPEHVDFLETRLDYDPDRLQVTMQCTEKRHVRKQAAGTAPRNDSVKRSYAVTFDVRDGGVILRECGGVPQSTGKRFGSSVTVREFVPQSAR